MSTQTKEQAKVQARHPYDAGHAVGGGTHFHFNPEHVFILAKSSESARRLKVHANSIHFGLNPATGTDTARRCPQCRWLAGACER